MLDRAPRHGEVRKKMTNIAIKSLIAAGLILNSATLAQANQIALLCSGVFSMPGRQDIKIQRQTATLDLDTKTFTPPLYPALPILTEKETEFTFGSESPSRSTWGRLDRISGDMNVMVLTPPDRQKLKLGEAGTSVQPLSTLSATCAPAQRMF
jgi:hypothetical protein